jgi:hypothetical protein
MTGKRKKILAMFAVLSLMVLGSGSAAQAAQPEFETVQVDDAFVLEGLCAFPIQIRYQGVSKISTHTDEDGEFAMQIDRGQWTTTITNVETGTSFMSVNTGPGIYRVQEDGTVQYARSGVQAIINVRGKGAVFHEVGRIVYDEDGSILFRAGQRQGTDLDVAALCEALATP